MKIRKNAEQRNFTVNKDMYTVANLKDMLDYHMIYWFDENLNQKSEYPEWWKFDETSFIVFAEDCEEVKVIYDTEFNFYTTVVITKSGSKIYVNV